MKLSLLGTMPTFFDNFEQTFSTVMIGDHFMDEDQSAYYLSLDLPGIKKEELNIELKNGNLIVKAESKGKKTRTYHKVFTLPNAIEVDSIEAELKDGVLNLKMPKLKEKVKLVQVK